MRKRPEPFPRDATREVLVEALVRAERRISRLKTAEKRRKQSNEKLRRLTYDLRERVKELNCLYSISNLVERQGASLEEILQGTVDLIPHAWQYPEITCSRIALKDRVFQTANFRETGWKQERPINVRGRIAGFIEIVYLEERPDRDEGPFLKEERSLLNVIAERVGEIIERKEREEALRAIEEKNRALLNAIPDLMFQMDGAGTLLALHEGGFTGLRPLVDELVGKTAYSLTGEKVRLSRRILDQGMVYVGRALATGKTQVFEQHLSFDGVPRDFEVRIGVSGENEVLGLVRDITLRKRLEREILEISGREQRRIGQDLHDSLCQHLAGVGFLSKVLEKKLGDGAAVEPREAAEITELIDQAITLTRGFARGLNPVRLEADGLVVALSELAAHSGRLFGITCRFECGKLILIHDDVTASHLYRIVQEALHNAIKHGKADKVDISLATDGKTNTLMVKDNGIGIGAVSQQGKGMGLHIMNYRASMIGASLDIRPGADGGTVLTCAFPNRGDG